MVDQDKVITFLSFCIITYLVDTVKQNKKNIYFAKA